MLNFLIVKLHGTMFTWTFVYLWIQSRMNHSTSLLLQMYLYVQTNLPRLSRGGHKSYRRPNLSPKQIRISSLQATVWYRHTLQDSAVPIASDKQITPRNRTFRRLLWTSTDGVWMSSGGILFCHRLKSAPELAERGNRPRYATIISPWSCTQFWERKFIIIQY